MKFEHQKCENFPQFSDESFPGAFQKASTKAFGSSATFNLLNSPQNQIQDAG
jgi:hypothetical protein